jgi:hypothetical protein
MYQDYVWDTYATKKFTDVFNSFDAFRLSYEMLDTSLRVVDYDTLRVVYYLLYANFGNSHIVNEDVNQWKYKVFSTIYMYAPIWKKKTEIQSKIRELSLDDEELFKGTKVIYNHSNNPSTSPSTSSLEELTTIDDQNTSTRKYSKLDAYARLYELIDRDITKEFIDKFKKLFIIVVDRSPQTIYGTEV